ncbi:MAG: hypothetical protein C0409_09480 [Novosphingobium sp.]|nr:hypothetical protein [Novosphingobium sp.]
MNNTLNSPGQQVGTPRRKVSMMYTARFFSTQLGRASLASIGAMVVLCCFALTQQVDAVPSVMASAAAITGELA